MSGSDPFNDAFIIETIANTIFDGNGEPVTLNGTFEVEFNAAGSLVGVSNISLVASSSDPDTSPSTLDSGTISAVGVPGASGAQGLNEIHVTADGGSFNQAYLDVSGEEPTSLAYDQSTGKYSSIGYYNGTSGGLEGIGSGAGGSPGTVGTITSTPLPLNLAGLPLDTFVNSTFSNVVFDGNGVPVTLSGVATTEYNAAGTLIGVSNVSVVASDPGDPTSYPSTLTQGTVIVSGNPHAADSSGLNEISLSIGPDGGGSFQHAEIVFYATPGSGLQSDTSAPYYSSVGYATGDEALSGGALSAAGTETDSYDNTQVMATISNVIFDGYGEPITLSGNYEVDFNPTGTLVSVENVNIVRTDNIGDTETLTGAYINHVGDPNAGGYAAINQIVFQSVSNGNYNNADYIDLLGETPNAVFTGSFNNNYSSDVSASPYSYEPINEGALSSGGTIVYSEIAACFAANTRITTPAGEVPVQSLKAGDMVTLAGGGAARIQWLGRRKLDIARHPRPDLVQPLCIAAGALGAGLPVRDLILSPDHAMFLDGLLIPAKTLLNGANITRLHRKSVTYYHIELAAHAVLLADGAPAESYLETGNRGAFENGGPAVTLHPDFAQTARETKGCAPFAESGPRVAAIRAAILARAGIATTNDAATAIKFRGGNAFITSRSGIPAELAAGSRDRRCLGIKIGRLRIGGETIPLDHPALVFGWHGAEPHGRWTNGNAIIPASLLNGSVDVEIEVAGILTYRRAA